MEKLLTNEQLQAYDAIVKFIPEINKDYYYLDMSDTSFTINKKKWRDDTIDKKRHVIDNIRDDEDKIRDLYLKIRDIFDKYSKPLDTKRMDRQFCLMLNENRLIPVCIKSRYLEFENKYNLDQSIVNKYIKIPTNIDDVVISSQKINKGSDPALSFYEYLVNDTKNCFDKDAITDIFVEVRNLIQTN